MGEAGRDRNNQRRGATVVIYPWTPRGRLLWLILTKLENLMTTQAELAASLASVSGQVAKIGTETDGLKARVADLEAALAGAGGTTPEVDAAMAALRAQVQLVDDLVADAP